MLNVDKFIFTNFLSCDIIDLLGTRSPRPAALRAAGRGLLLCKNYLDQKHITKSSQKNADQGVSLPKVCDRHHGAAHQCGDPSRKGCDRHSSQAEHHQHSHHCGRKRLSQFLDPSGDPSPSAECQKGQKSDRRRDQRDHRNGDPRIEVMIHGAPPLDTSIAARR